MSAEARLRLASDLSLPIAAVTEKLNFLGRTGSGKTYAAQKLAEEMHRAGAQFVVLDPVGTWWALRLAADGKRPGLPIPVLGGLHGDIPIEAGAGALVANLVVDRGVSMVLDVSQFESDADKARFAHAFAERFFFRKKAAPSAVHVFIEEAQEFVPQNPQREEARMLHAFTRLVKIGRNFGIGVSLLSQRPQEVNKKVLNQTELLFCFQLTGPQERKTIQGWIAEKGIDEDIAGELPKLERGQPHVWSPAWLKISKRVRIEAKTTFDASSTPAVGKAADTRALSPIDLAAFHKEMAATIERAKAEDPRELRRQLAEVRAELAKLKAKPTAAGKETRVEIPMLKASQIKRLESLAGRVEAILNRFGNWEKAFQARGEDLRAAAAEISATVRARIAPTPAPVSPRTEVIRQQQRAPAGRTTAVMVSRRAEPVEGITPAKQRILDALAFLEGIGLTQADKTQLALMADTRPTSGAYFNNLGALRSAALISYPRAGTVALTDAGRETADPGTAPGTAGELQALIRAKVSPAKWRLLEVLIGVYPKPLSKDDLAARAGARETSGAYFNNLGSLRSLGLVDYPSPRCVALTPGQPGAAVWQRGHGFVGALAS